MTAMNQRPTEKQTAARKRAWLIFRLRGLHAQAHMLTGYCQAIALAAIDAELMKLGAQTEYERKATVRAEWEEIK